MRFPTGCGTALVTPFAADESVDEAALKALVEWQIEEGIDFLVACGSTGEAQTMTPKERERVVALVLETARGRVPVVAGATSNDTAAAVTETRAMCGLGADGILSACPYYNKPTQRGLERHFSAVADASDKPVVLYNVPGRSAVNLEPATALKLARHGNISAIKEASGNILQMMAILADRPDTFSVLSGDDALTLPLAALGGDGIISVVSNQVPRLVTMMTQSARAGDMDAARLLHFRLLPLINADFLETNPAPVKAGLALMGRIEEVLRLPMVPVTAATRARLAEVLRDVEAGVGV